MTYEFVVRFAKVWGTVFAMVPFIIAVAYALWPSNKDKFANAARAPLDLGDE